MEPGQHLVRLLVFDLIVLLFLVVCSALALQQCPVGIRAGSLASSGQWLVASGLARGAVLLAWGEGVGEGQTKYGAGTGRQQGAGSPCVSFPSSIV